LITLHPSYLTPALGEAIRDCDKVDRYLPLPAQAGSDALLKRMKRGYTLDLYRQRVDILRELVPDVELGSDWIVGFCGETEEEFQGSIDFLEEQQFLVNYIFKYDPRPGTRAEGERLDDVSTALKKERNQRLLAAAERVQRARFTRYHGQQVDAWVDSVSERDGRILLGRTRQGMAISFPGDAGLVGSMARVLVAETSAYGMGGSLVTGS
jgi:tRNA-2-methylthio-N6-dimethylallyladenosine synthase